MTAPAPSAAHHDVVVVGARCAGAATALLLARAGLDVAVVDRSRPGADTLSTHALMRGAVLQLARWGVLEAIVAAGTPAIRRTVFHYGDDAIDVAIKPRDGLDALYAPRRTVLDVALADAAAAAGAELRYGVRVVDLERRDDGRVSGVVLEGGDGRRELLRAGLVVGADGRRSTVARLAGAARVAECRNTSGVIYGYFSGTGFDANHWYYRPGVGAGAIPTNHGAACVFAAATADRYEHDLRGDLGEGFARVLAECSTELADAVATASPAGGLRGFPGEVGFLRKAWGPGWALVGDAGYFKDPITAHGITDALRDAELLARAVLAGAEADLAAYETARDDLARPFLGLTDAIAAYDWTLPEVQEMHRELSQEMNREYELLAALGHPVSAAA